MNSIVKKRTKRKTQIYWYLHRNALNSPSEKTWKTIWKIKCASMEYGWNWPFYMSIVKNGPISEKNGTQQGLDIIWKL